MKSDFDREIVAFVFMLLWAT